MKFKCESCDKANAEWCYMPKAYYLCDDCIIPNEPDYKGCSCNWHYIDVDAYSPTLEKPDLPEEGKEGEYWKWVEKDVCWQNIDEKGRPFPCCEYEYSENGWDETTFELIERLDTPETYQDALEAMNHYFNNWINSGSYDIVNKLLESFIKEDYSLSLNLNLLLLTNKVKNKINKSGDGRKLLFDFTKSKCLQVMSVSKTDSCINYLE